MKINKSLQDKFGFCNCRGNMNANNPELPCSSCGGINPMKSKIIGEVPVVNSKSMKRLIKNAVRFEKMFKKETLKLLKS